MDKMELYTTVAQPGPSGFKWKEYVRLLQVTSVSHFIHTYVTSMINNYFSMCVYMFK